MSHLSIFKTLDIKTLLIMINDNLKKYKDSYLSTINCMETGYTCTIFNST